MSTPILGQFDPAFTQIMNETMVMLRQVFQTKNQWTFPIDGTSRSGIEAVLTSILAPGDKVLIPIFGRFGHLLTEIAERNGAEIHTIETEWGQVFDQDEIIKAMERVKPKVLAIVHGETSTGCMQPLDKLGKACREMDILCVVDAVATIAGTEVKVDEWQLDAVIGGTQKCFSVPSGMAPITYNERVEKLLASRKKSRKRCTDNWRCSGSTESYSK
jgi:(S)-ureidoglycine-glyoxylate aminotransferase